MCEKKIRIYVKNKLNNKKKKSICLSTCKNKNYFFNFTIRINN